MKESYQLRGYIVEPKSTLNIRTIAIHVRKVLEMSDKAVNMERFLEELCKWGIVYDVVDDSDMPGFSIHSEAYCVPETATIYLTSETYEKACNGDARTRFTIFHELGHLLLGHSRKFHRGQTMKELKCYFDSEWQADQFAAEMIMPLDIIIKHALYSVKKIQERFLVSAQAAQRRYDQLKNNNYIKI